MDIRREIPRWPQPGNGLLLLFLISRRDSEPCYKRSIGRNGYHWITNREPPNERHGSVFVDAHVSFDSSDLLHRNDNHFRLAARIALSPDKEKIRRESEILDPMVSQGVRRGARVQGDAKIRGESRQTIVVRHFEGAQDSSLPQVNNHSLGSNRVQSIVRDKQHSILHGADFDHSESQCHGTRASGDNSDGRWCRCVVFIDIRARQIRKEISHDHVLQRDPPVLRYFDS